MPVQKLQHLVPIKSVPMKRAAAYVRMSTEHQKYSTTNQMIAIKEYAVAHGFSIVHLYSDEGISGLQMKDRAGLKQLINDVLKGKATFTTALVYDISRWGRFQDVDQSAFYECLCRMHGVDVVYCAEVFHDDHSPLSAILKCVRRVEAADFSRDLSVKVFRGQCNLASRGHVQGGTPRYGLKHILVRDDGKPVKRPFRRTKRLRGYHVELAPGPPKEARIVREIFRRYVELGERKSEIAARLNSKGYRTRKGFPWNCQRIDDILVDEQYIGTLVYNKISQKKLQSRCKRNNRSDWIRKANPFQAIVDPAVFQRAQERRRKDVHRSTDEELLAKLRRFISRHGFITQKAMREFGGVPPHGIYARRFGSIFRAFELIGYKWRSKSAYWNERIRRRRLRVPILEELTRILDGMGVPMQMSVTGSRFCVDDMPCYFQLSTRSTSWRGRAEWVADFTSVAPTTFRLLARLDSDGETVIDYYLIPRSALRQMPSVFKARNGGEVDRYRIRDLAAVADRLVVARTKSRPTLGLMLPRVTS